MGSAGTTVKTVFPAPGPIGRWLSRRVGRGGGRRRSRRSSRKQRTPDGKYYIVAPEPDVRVPVNKSYADKPEILTLPKDAKGQYYVAGAGGRA